MLVGRRQSKGKTIKTILWTKQHNRRLFFFSSVLYLCLIKESVISSMASSQNRIADGHGLGGCWFERVGHIYWLCRCIGIWAITHGNQWNPGKSIHNSEGGKRSTIGERSNETVVFLSLDFTSTSLVLGTRRVDTHTHTQIVCASSNIHTIHPYISLENIKWCVMSFRCVRVHVYCTWFFQAQNHSLYM